MEKVRIGIVGSKFAAGFHRDSYSRNEHAELVAVAAVDNLEAISSKWNIPHSYLAAASNGNFPPTASE